MLYPSDKVRLADAAEDLLGIRGIAGTVDVVYGQQWADVNFPKGSMIVNASYPIADLVLIERGNGERALEFILD